MTWKVILYSIWILFIIFLAYPPIIFTDYLSDFLSSERELDQRNSCFEYISKYKYALQNELPTDLEPNGRYQNCVWTLWLQGEENAPQIVKNCIKSFRVYLKNYRLIVLDENSIQKYVHIPKIIMDKYKSGAISKTYFSDIVRYCLLYKYGGLWLDSTVLLTDKFPDKILNQNFFMFSNCRFRSNYKPLTATWLIYSKQPGNVIFKDIINLNLEYWRHEDKLALYYLVYIFFAFAVESDPEAKLVFEKMPYVREQNHFFTSYVAPYSDEFLSKLLQYSHFPIHKLSYKDQTLLHKGVIDENTYKNSILHFFYREDILKELQKRGLAGVDC